jgi:hypothetical protein
MPQTSNRPEGTPRPAPNRNQITPSIPGRYDLAAGLARRREAASRLPPLACGCRDPLSRQHLEDRCRWRRNWRAA